jgi:hypothetical protein
LFTAHSVCGIKPKTFEIRGQVIKNTFFGSVPKSHPDGFTYSVKNASEKFSRLGTFNCFKLQKLCVHFLRKNGKKKMFDDVDDVLPIFLKLKRDILTTLDLPYDTF